MNMGEACPVCASPLRTFERCSGGRDAFRYSCPQCGNFILSGTLAASLPGILDGEPDASPKISHAIRTMQQVNEGAELHTNTVTEILKRPLPSPREQADLLIRWLAQNAPAPGESVEVEAATHSAVIGAKTEDGFFLVLRHLVDEGLVLAEWEQAMGTPDRVHAMLSFKGWDYFESLRRGGATYRRAFMAMEYGDPELDKVVDAVFRPAVGQAGFELFRLDDEPRAGLIDDQLRVEIQNADFLIADLSHDNHGAYWEAGYAEGLGKPVIYTCEAQKFEEKKTHFDTNHHLTIVWDKGDPEEAGQRLKATIRATLPELAKQEDA